MSSSKPTLQDVCLDLKNILEKLFLASGSDDSAVSYSSLSDQSSDLILPALTYFRFLNDEGFIEINRVEDTVRLKELGENALNDDFDLMSRIDKEFSERLDKLNNGEGGDSPSEGASETRRSVNAQQYERIKEIGTGGIGTVYLATQKPLNRKVAIKEVREIFSIFAGVKKNDIIARFRKVVHAQATLDHPNIIHLIDLVLDDTYPFVVMSYASNGNLRRLIDSDERVPLEVSLKYFLQILHAFNAAHQSDIFHGAVKPENVVLDASGNALVTDFGMTLVADLESNGGNQVYVGVGSVAYMPPEQFVHPNKATATSDIYSLGILLYEMLTGKMPGRRSPMPSSFYPDIPRKLDDIFDKMSMDDPGERYQSVEEILLDIYRCEEIMRVLDKRTGFQFLRDPITYGPVGLAQLEALPSHEPPPRAELVEEEELSEQLPHHYQQEQNYRDEQTATDEQPVEHPSHHYYQHGEENAPPRGEESGSDIINKLDRYSGMFEEEGDSDYSDD